MIKFIEKERYYDDSPYTGSCYYYPTYMVKDEKEFFVFNRRDPNDEWKIKEDEKRKNQLIENEGKYFKFNGFYDNPLEMLKKIIERKHHFTTPKNMYYGNLDTHRYIDFHGNRNEVSAAFHYRIYDIELACIIQKVVKLINSEDWSMAKVISDCDWYELTRQLTYKADWNNRQYIKIGRFVPSSQTCSCCGFINVETKDLSVREWTCPKCGVHHDRDINAAKNILNEGLRLLEKTA